MVHEEGRSHRDPVEVHCSWVEGGLLAAIPLVQVARLGGLEEDLMRDKLNSKRS